MRGHIIFRVICSGDAVDPWCWRSCINELLRSTLRLSPIHQTNNDYDARFFAKSRGILHLVTIAFLTCQRSSQYVPDVPTSLKLFLTNVILAWEAATEKAQDFVSQLSTDEKIGIVSGAYRQPGPSCIGQIGAIPRLNFTGICYADGPAGFGRSDGVSVFPSGLSAAATWDTSLMYERGVALGEEFRGKGANVHLG